MTVQQIAEVINDKSVEWTDNSEVMRLCFQPLVQDKLKSLIKTSIDQHLKQGLELQDLNTIASMLRQSVAAGFILGAGAGLQIDRPDHSQPDHIRPAADAQPIPDDSQTVLRFDPAPDIPCPTCLQTGETCRICSWSRYDCICQAGDFRPVKCSTCDGDRVIPKEGL